MGQDEEEMLFGTVDFIIFVSLLVVSAGIGIYFAYKDRKKTTTENYYFADRRMSPVLVAMSMAVSVISAMTVLGIPVEVYLHGFVLMWILPSTALATLIAVLYHIPFIYKLRLNTIYKYLELRFNRSVRLLCSGVNIFGWILYMGITVYVPALGLNAVTPLDLNTAIALTSIVCTFYTTLGGMKAVIWTDMLQGMIMLFGSVAVFAKVLVIIGGFGNLIEAVERGGRNNFFKTEMDPRVRSSVLSIFAGMLINSCVGACCSQIYSQRYLSCKSARNAQIASALSVVPIALFMLLAAANGLAMYAYYEGCDPVQSGRIQKQDQATPRLAVEIFRDMPGMAGLFVSAAYSGTLSTVSSGVNALSAMTLEDFVLPHWTNSTPNRVSVLSKILTFLFGASVMCVAYIVSCIDATIVQVSLALAGVINGPILSVYTMGIFCPWTNNKGALAGLVVGWLTSAWISLCAIFYGPDARFYQPLPLSTDACNLTLSSSNEASGYMDVTTFFNDATLSELSRARVADTVYSVSPFLYGVIGFFTSCLTTIIVTLLTGRNRPEEANPDLFLPLLDNEKIFPQCMIRFFRFGVGKPMDKDLL